VWPAWRARCLGCSNTLAVLGGGVTRARRRVRHLWHVHEMVEQPRAAAWLFPRLVRLLADRVVCNSHATQGWLLQSQPVLRERTQVVWNGVSTDDGADVSGEAALRARFRPLGQTLAVGLVGRINRMKGHGVLLEAAERLQAQGRHDFSIVFVGDAPPDQPQHRLALQQRVAGSALAQRVVFAGFVHDIPAAMRALDVICVPSTEAEAFGLVAVEAMAAARPSLASRCGGLPEVLGDEAAAWLHAPGDAATLAQQLHRLLNDAALRQRVGDAGRARYLRHFTSAAMAERMVRALAEAHAR
jgi:glycosyltransferase involved in cell wall biosynthesis